MFKKTLAMLLCIVLVLALATVAFAEESEHTIIIEAESATEKTMSQEKYHLYDENYLDHTTRVFADDGYEYPAPGNTDIILARYNDWFTYTVEVATAGTYTFGINGGYIDRDSPFDIYVDDAMIGTGTFMDHDEGYGSPNAIVDDDLITMDLTAGTHTIKLSIQHKANHQFWIDHFYLDLDTPAEEPELPEILKGSATVDGVLDEAYKNSYTVSVGKESPIWVPKEDPDDVKTTVYFLHDGEYLYVCAEVTGDSTIVDTNAAGWVVDGIDVWFLSPEANVRSKITLDAFAQAYDADNKYIGQWENGLEIDLTKIEKAAVRGEGSYVVEAKIPVAWYSESEGTIGFNIQLNNCYDADANTDTGNKKGGYYGAQFQNGPEHIVALSDTPAVSEPPVTEPSDPGISETGDVISLIVAMLAVSGLGITVVSKKKF